jgi:hypothetical protein
MSGYDHDRTGEEDLTRDAQRLLRQSADDLPAATRSRLNQARQKALAEFDRRGGQPAGLGVGWKPVAMTAVVALLVVAVWLGRMSDRQAPAPEVAATATPATAEGALELELMLADENLEMIEDLEFYDWLDAGMAGAGGDDPEVSG